jgi:hypothetical protein
VRGQGNIGSPINVAGTNVLTNNGLISADVAGGTLNITPPAGSGSFINDGTLQAVSGGTLLLSTNIAATAGSQIISGAGSAVVQNGVRINGVFTSSGGGNFTAVSSASNFLDAVNFAGTLDLGSIANARERIINGATINGAINVANGGILSLDSSATAGGNQALAGTVVINLNDPGARLAIEGNGSTTLGSGVTVRGQGNIGIPVVVGGTNTLTNNGLISADVGGGTLDVTKPGNSGSFINNGTLQAINGGTLKLSTNITANASGQIIAGAGSAVVQNGVTVNGVINAGGTGVFTATSDSRNFLDGVNFTGTLDLGSIVNARERIINGATLNGAINLANGGFLSLDSAATTGSAQTIGGTAVINLNDANTRLSIEGNGSTTLGSGITVRGQGTIGVASIVGGTNVLTSNGLISADINGGTLNIVPPANSGSFINNGTLQAINGSTLLLSTNITANAGSQIIAGAGSSVVQNGVAINGVVNASGTGVFTATSDSRNFLDGVNFTGTLDLTSIVNSRERIINGATLNGAINLGNGGFLSLDSNATPGGIQALAGTAVINLNDSTARLSIEGNGSTTLGSGITVRGQGNVGVASIVGGTNTLTNNGLISADVAGGTLTLAPPANSGSLVNNSTLQAIGGGRLLLSTNINNAAGLITAQNGSTVVQNGVTITGGTIASSGTGSFQALSNSNNVLNGGTVAGTVDLTTIVNSRERIINGATVNGAINVANGGILSMDSNATSGGAQTVAGTGVINLNDAGARLAIEGNGSTTLAAGLTVRGQGNIGQPGIVGGTNTLFNNGTILADGGTLTIVNPANNGTLAGTGTLQTSGGTLNLATTTGSTQGRLVMGGAGSALNLNTQNLTITSDYTNAQSGSGNSFNKRAGVSGTGKILAAGNVAQAVTGANVANGTTATPTLTIGNVHVGANTFNYQVTNTGATGPSLRGAIQTNVNGGNINDARLSVTPGNWGPVAPGASSGNLGVTFTEASAGLLSTLSGQVVHIVNNFDNVAGQNLNIALGASAAAYRLAQPGAHTPEPVSLANIRVGGSFGTQALSVQNTAANDGFSESLNASIGGATGGAAASGSFNLLAAQATNSTNLIVGLGNANTNVAGAKTGTATISFVSDGTGTSGLGQTPLTGQNQTVNISGKVYQIAQPTLVSDTIVFTNRHVGDAATQALSLTNTSAAPAGYQEGLNASFSGTTGHANATGSVALLGQGSTNNSSLVVGIDTSNAGAKSGTAGLTLQSDGAGTSGLGTLGLTPQTINVSGNVYRLASAQINNTGAFGFGNVHVGDTVQQALSITNNVANDVYSEKLSASFGSTSDGRITTSGSVNLLGAGLTDATSMLLGVNTSAAGVVNGTATVNFSSDGAGTSGLGITALAPQNVSVTATIQGGVYRLANPVIQTVQPVDFGNVRIGAVVGAQALSIKNDVPSDGFSEKLNASANGTTGGVTASGSFNLLAPQAVNSTDILVGLNTSVAGNRSGGATINFASDGTGTSGLGTTALTPQTVNVSGNVYRLANPTLNTPSVTLAARVGDGSPSATISLSNASPDIYTEGLKASINTVPAGFTNTGGSISNLAAQGTDASILKVGLVTATAGSFTGNAVLSLASTGAGTTGAPDLPLTGQNVALTGKVYTPAVGQVASTTIDFGIVHKGDVVTPKALTVTNAAPSTALNDVLIGSFGSASNPFSASGNLGSGLAAGASNSSGLLAGLNTSSAGVFNGSATVNLISHNSDMADLPLSDTNINLLAQVNNYANPVFDKVSGDGAFSSIASTFTLDFGTMLQNSGLEQAALRVLNNVGAPADFLDGSFVLPALSAFGLSGFGPFSNIAAGNDFAGLSVVFDTSALGNFTDTITLHPTGHNASGYSGTLSDIQLVLMGDVIPQGTSVPEPSALLLMGAGFLAIGLLRKRFKK